jgi:S-adenosylmethionine decarboxylase
VRRETGVTGVEWVIDARGCDPSKLTDRASLQDLLDGIVGDLSLNVVGEPLWHTFPGAGGVTGLCLLSESHLAIHTFPEHGSLCLNVFCCRPRGDWDVEARLRHHVAASDVDVTRIERTYAELSAPLAPP